VLKEDGTIVDVNPGAPLAAAGAAPGMRVRAVDGRRFSPEILREAIHASKVQKSITLIVENGDWWRTLDVAWDGGARSPHLERVDGTPDLLQAIFAPRAKAE